MAIIELLHRDTAQQRLVDGMLGELELVALEAGFDGIEVDHRGMMFDTGHASAGR